MPTHRDNYLTKLRDDFVFADHRLGDHPKVGLTVYSKQPDDTYIIVHDRGLFRQYFMTGSVLTIPLGEGESRFGALLFDAKEPNFFSKRDFGLAQLLAALIVFTRTHLEPRNRLITPASIELGEALKRVRNELGLTQTQLAQRINQSRIALSRWEGGAQPPSFGPLYSWGEALGLFSPSGRALVTVVDVTPELLKTLREDPRTIHNLSPEQFENFVAERLDRMGYDVQLSRGTVWKDGGIDLIAIPKVRTVGAFLLAGQVKHHSMGAKAGIEAIQRLLAWKNSVFRLGLLVTNTDFTQDAKWHAAREDNRFFLRLRYFDDLKRWIEDNFTSEQDWREIPEEIEITRGVTIRIPKPRVSNSLDIWPLDRLNLEKL